MDFSSNRGAKAPLGGRPASFRNEEWAEKTRVARQREFFNGLLAPANEIDRELIVGRGAFERTPPEAEGDPGFDFDQSSVEVLIPDEES